jgi:indolepyruvate decarboxylase
MAEMTISAYLIQQLLAHGVRHVFGIPGDYSLSFIDELAHSPLTFVNTCDEQGAGFAADGYARLAGLGVVCVTYAVGSLKVTNAAAQAHAERSPLLIICGSPGLRERALHPLLHHRVGEFDSQMQIFRQLTVASAALHDPETAGAEIDRLLHAAQRQQRPVYLELPRDMVKAPVAPGHRHEDVPVVSDPEALAEALREAIALLAAARQPVIIAGVELARFGLQQALVHFASAANIPVAVTMQGKAVVCDECLPYLGVYVGAAGPEAAARYVESSDCLLLLGTLLTDMNLGMFTANLERERMILANSEGVAIHHHSYDVQMADFVLGLQAAALPRKPETDYPRPPEMAPFIPEPGTQVTVRRLFECLATAIVEETVVLADIGDSLFGSLELPTRRGGHFLANAYYSNMGFAVPGSIGAQLACPSARPLVLVGDGSFQMTGQELATAARFGANPIVVVLNNDGYATERFFLDGAFNDIQRWAYHRLPEVLGAGAGFPVNTEEELAAALHAAAAYPGPALLDVHLARGDVSHFLKKLGERLGKTVRG